MFSPSLSHVPFGNRSSIVTIWCSWEAILTLVFHLVLFPPSLPLPLPFESQLVRLASLKAIIYYLEIPQDVLLKGYPPKISR